MAVDRAKRFEGFSKRVYICPSGFKTIGYGHNLETNPIDEAFFGIIDGEITQEDAHHLLAFDLIRVYNLLKKEEFFISHQGVFYVQLALLDMAFNIGINKLKTFRKMILALEAGEFYEAAQEVKNSKYFTQVGARAEENAFMIENNRPVL